MKLSNNPANKPPGRWSDEETALLQQMREQLGTKLTERRQLIDVVGDRRLLRFLRGHGKIVVKACEVFSKFLSWRDENKVDQIRDNILKSPSVDTFPNAKKILGLVSQIVVAHDALDNYGNPMCFENFSFDPDAVLKSVTKEEYIEFMIYTLEYRAMVLDQLSEEKEEAYLKSCNYKPAKSEKGYGVMLQVTCIRDCHGLGLGHVSASGRTVLGWIIALAGPNYPETLFRSYMIKVPFMIDMVWVVIKQFMDPNTVAKNVMVGSSYLTKLQEDMPQSSIPVAIGGTYSGFNVPYSFNLEYFADFKSDDALPPVAVSSRETVKKVETDRETNKRFNSFIVNPNDEKLFSNELNSYIQELQRHPRSSHALVLTTTVGKHRKSWLPDSTAAHDQSNADFVDAFPSHKSSLLTTRYGGIQRVAEFNNINDYFDMAFKIPKVTDFPIVASNEDNSDPGLCLLS